LFNKQAVLLNKSSWVSREILYQSE